MLNGKFQMVPISDGSGRPVGYSVGFYNEAGNLIETVCYVMSRPKIGVAVEWVKETAEGILQELQKEMVSCEGEGEQ